MSLIIKSVLEIRTFTHEPGLTIPLKQGNYNYLIGNEDVCIVSEKETINPSRVEWDFVGEEGYYSIGSDALLLSIQDRKSQTDDIINADNTIDIIDNFMTFEDCGIFMTPSGHSGGAYVYTSKNEKGHIIAVRLCYIEPDEIKDALFSLR